MPDRVLPIVRLFFVCAEAVFELEEEVWSLKAPLHTVKFPPGIKGNFRQEELWLYAQLTDGLGDFNLSVQLQHLESGGIGSGRASPNTARFPLRIGSVCKRWFSK